MEILDKKLWLPLTRVGNIEWTGNFKNKKKLKHAERKKGLSERGGGIDWNLGVLYVAIER